MPQAIGFAIASLVGASVTAATATTIGTIALNVGLGLASTALSLIMAPKVESKPSEAQQEIKQPLAPRTKSYGRVRKSGTVFWFDTDPASRSTRRDLYMGLALNHGRIAGFDSYHIDDNEVTIDGSGSVTTEPYGGNVVLTTKLGAPVETAYSVLDDRFNMPNMRGDGVATILGKFRNSSDASNQMERYPGGIPQLRVTMRASVCFDPREPAHDVNDQSTWTWSENLGVIILNYLIDPDGYGMPYSKIEANLDQWIEQLNICDEDVPLKAGGTEKRYRGAGTYDLTERPRDVVERMLAACDGRVWQKRDGSVGFLVGQFSEPTVTIESRDILSYSLEHGQDALTAVAGLRAQFMSPDHDYREHDAEPWPSGEEVLAFDEDRVAALDLLWAPAHGQCRRIMKRQYLRQRASWRGSISTNLAGLRAIDERYIRVVVDELGIDESFEVGKFTLDPSTLRCQIEIVSVGAEIDEWDPDTEEGQSALSGAEFFASTVSEDGNFTWPEGVQAGDVAVAIDVVGTTGGPTKVVPDGFKEVHTAAGGYSGGFSVARLVISRRICDGGEADAFAGMASAGADFASKTILVFRPIGPLVNATENAVSSDITSGNPVARTLSTSSANTPLVVICFVQGVSGTAAFSTATPSFDGMVVGATSLTGYKIYNAPPASNFTVDANDLGLVTTLAAFSLSLT